MDLHAQYEFIRSSRQVLLDYCERLTNKHFLADNSNFGRGSVRNLLVHTGNTYEFWIGNQALGKQLVYTSYESVTAVLQARVYYHYIDALMEAFIKHYAHDYFTPLQLSINDKPVNASPFKLFTHVITHEFHHKGQILSLTRHLGYIPVDTDVIR